MAASNDAKIWGVLAASGSGKGLWIKQELRKLRPRRMVVWDYKDEYSEFAHTLTHSLETVRRAMLKAGTRGGLVIRYKCKPGTNVKQTKAEFEALCRLVQAWGSCVFLAEELSNVTTPSWAPAAWREMTTGGRHELVHIIGVAQNPALIDKTFMSNCTLLHVGPLREHHHRQAVSRSMDVPIAEVTALVQFEYIERDFDKRTTRRGRVLPPGATPTGRGAKPTATDGAEAGQPTRQRRKSTTRATVPTSSTLEIAK